MNLARRVKTPHLALILKIAETGRLQVAAETLGMSQPAASRILTEIEKETGHPLFLRNAKGMEPTRVGAAFVKHGRAILAEFENLKSEVESINVGHLGEVRIGSVTGPAVACLVPAILKIKKTSPGIELTVDVGPSTALLRGLDEGHFDFVLCRPLAEHDSRGYKILPARSEIVSLVARKGHPLEGRRNIALSELTDLHWVIQERGTPVRQAVENAFHAAALPTPASVTNSSSLLVMLAATAQSDAVATLSEEVANLLVQEPLGADLFVLDLDRRITVSPYFIIRNRNLQLSSAAELVLSEVMRRL